MSLAQCSVLCVNSVLNVKVIVGAFSQEKALVGAFSVIVKTDCRTESYTALVFVFSNNLYSAFRNSNGLSVP